MEDCYYQNLLETKDIKPIMINVMSHDLKTSNKSKSVGKNNFLSKKDNIFKVTDNKIKIYLKKIKIVNAIGRSLLIKSSKRKYS